MEYARDFATGNAKGQSGGSFGKASAVLCLYWFGMAGRDLSGLFSAQEAPLLPAVVARAWLATVVARESALLRQVQARLVGHPSDDVARLSRFLDDVASGAMDKVGNYKNQKSRWPRSGKFYDARAWLQLEVLSSAGSAKLRATAKADLNAFSRLARTNQETRVLSRIQLRMGL
jgi:hypothetical protein